MHSHSSSSQPLPEVEFTFFGKILHSKNGEVLGIPSDSNINGNFQNYIHPEDYLLLIQTLSERGEIKEYLTREVVPKGSILIANNWKIIEKKGTRLVRGEAARIQFLETNEVIKLETPPASDTHQVSQKFY
jgi:hypothetical protein